MINLDDDILERNNLENEYPEIVAKLGEELDEWQNSMGTSLATEMHSVIENGLFYFINKQQHAER